MDGYSELRLNDFLFNAGVVGLLRIFHYDDVYGDGCEQGVDYIIDGQSLYVSNDYLMSRDIGDLFVRAMVHYLGPTTKFERDLEKRSLLDVLYAEPKPEDKQWRSSVDSLYKDFVEMLTKNSFKSGYVILSGLGVDFPFVELALTIKQEADYLRKKERYDKLWTCLQEEKVREILIFKDLLYSVIRMFYADNKGNGAAFLSKREIEPTVAYHDKFIEPLRHSLTDRKSKSIIHCITCGTPAEKKLAAPVTLFVDTADDLGKKKSYYWNCNPDAHLCPLCTFVCSLAPLGFTYLGNDGVLVNNNCDVETLWGFANAIAEKTEGDNSRTWFKLYNSFTSEKISHLSEKVTNIQVIIREKNNERYRLNTVDKATVLVFKSRLKDFQSLKSRFIKDSGGFLNVYQLVVENVLTRRNQYSLMTRLIRASLSGDVQQSGYIYTILRIQITQKGGEHVDNKLKRAYSAKSHGHALRMRLTEGLAESDKDNRLRGLVYQLLNTVSLGNRDKFMELVLRTYSGINLPVPDIFFSCFGGDDDFKEIGFAYLLGLKSDYQKKEEEKES